MRFKDEFKESESLSVSKSDELDMGQASNESSGPVLSFFKFGN